MKSLQLQQSFFLSLFLSWPLHSFSLLPPSSAQTQKQRGLGRNWQAEELIQLTNYAYKYNKKEQTQQQCSHSTYNAANKTIWGKNVYHLPVSGKTKFWWWWWCLLLLLFFLFWVAYLILAHLSGKSLVLSWARREVEVPQSAWRCVSHADRSSDGAGGRSTGPCRRASSQRWTARSPLMWKRPRPRSSCSGWRAAHNPGALRRRRGPPGGRPCQDAPPGPGSPSEPPAAGPPAYPPSTAGAGSHRAKPRRCPATPRTLSSLHPRNVSLSELETREWKNTLLHKASHLIDWR